jgi:hydrogenase maturation protein HypF
LADYQGFARLGWLHPVPLPGGTQAIRQPWRNCFAQLHSAFGWQAVRQRWGELEILQWLERQPVEMLSGMIEQGINVPLTSSCGRLCDAFAALLGICRAQISYEGQAAIELEALVSRATMVEETAYPFARVVSEQGSILDPRPLWQAALADLQQGVSPRRMAARFHAGLADAVTELALELARQQGIRHIALSGGVFQNRTLFERMVGKLHAAGMQTLTHRVIPPNDGGLALGQAVIVAARRLMGADHC